MTRHFWFYLAAAMCFGVALVLDITDTAEFLMTWAGWVAAGLVLATIPKLLADKPV